MDKLGCGCRVRNLPTESCDDGNDFATTDALDDKLRTNDLAESMKSQELYATEVWMDEMGVENYWRC